MAIDLAFTVEILIITIFSLFEIKGGVNRQGAGCRGIFKGERTTDFVFVECPLNRLLLPRYVVEWENLHWFLSLHKLVPVFSRREAREPST